MSDDYETIMITETKEIEKQIAVKFPYYYKNDLCPDNGKYVIYGKIEKIGVFSIRHECRCDCGYDDGDYKKYGFEVIYNKFETPQDISSYSCYFTAEHKINKQEFLGIKKEALAFLSSEEQGDE